MSVGYPQDKATIDQRAGAIAVNVRNVLNDATSFKAFLTAKTDAQLIALGYAQADVDALRQAYLYLDLLNQVFQGAITVPTKTDVRPLIAPVTGVN